MNKKSLDLLVKGFYAKNLNNSNEILNELNKVDKTGEAILYAGINWPIFDYKKGLKFLISKKNPEFIFNAGQKWRKKDISKLTKALVQNDKTGIWVFRALRLWKNIDYMPILNNINKFPKQIRMEIMELINTNPKGLKPIENKLQKNKAIKPKKFKLKEEIRSLI